ncbi:hypothetical protein SeLEV6574_g03293 [Synchytrium endobioticum]|uniref:Uncharacterized protein n=1 Tax=Synchytrium endobioticum TaxID=286115 RepID=A0A507D4F2_9FUNG|nr:hypothetical protein SeLEV6574_g03293 [Synchytrium endobioticum]
MQSPPEDRNYAYNYEPISNHGFGYGLEASTSQPRPQPVLIDFLGVKDMTREATPELAPRWGHSHDDRDPLPDNRYSNELRRPSRDHVGFVGGSGMHPVTSTESLTVLKDIFGSSCLANMWILHDIYSKLPIYLAFMCTRRALSL